jgi:hypothetical protein
MPGRFGHDDTAALIHIATMRHTIEKGSLVLAVLPVSHHMLPENRSASIPRRSCPERVRTGQPLLGMTQTVAVDCRPIISERSI